MSIDDNDKQGYEYLEKNKDDVSTFRINLKHNNKKVIIGQGFQNIVQVNWQKHGWRIEGVEQVEVDDTESSVGGMVKDVNSLQMKRIKSDGNKIQTLSPGEKINLKEFLDEQVDNTKTIDSYEMKPDSVVVNGKKYKTLEDLDNDIFF